MHGGLTESEHAGVMYMRIDSNINAILIGTQGSQIVSAQEQNIKLNKVVGLYKGV